MSVPETPPPAVRRGRLRREPTVATSVKIPQSLYLAYASASTRSDLSIHRLLIQALRAYRTSLPR